MNAAFVGQTYQPRNSKVSSDRSGATNICMCLRAYDKVVLSIQSLRKIKSTPPSRLLTAMSSGTDGQQATPMTRRPCVLITGSTDGIGRQNAKMFLLHGYDVILHGRNKQRLDQTVHEMRQVVESNRESIDKNQRNNHMIAQDTMPQLDLPKIDSLLYDVSSINQLREMGAELQDKYTELDILVNNAAVFMQSRTESVDGYEQTFATNVIAPYLLTSFCLPLLRAAAIANPAFHKRIINVSSISHLDGDRFRSSCTINWDDLQAKKNPYSSYSAYGLSKLAMVMFTWRLNELETRASDGRITVNTLDPGTVNTKMLLAGWGPCGIPVHEANDIFWLSTSREVENLSCAYFVNRRRRQPCQPNPSILESANLDRLWNVLADMTGDPYRSLYPT